MIIAGDGPAVCSLKNLARELNLTDNTQFIGYLSRNGDLPDCYAAANIFVFASRTETQGLVLLEAMASGTCVVSTAVMGTKDVLRENQGALIAKETIPHFSNKVIKLLENSDTAWLLAQNGRLYASKWSVSELTNRLCLLYKSTVEKNDHLIPTDDLLHDIDLL